MAELAVDVAIKGTTFLSCDWPWHVSHAVPHLIEGWDGPFSDPVESGEGENTLHTPPQSRIGVSGILCDVLISWLNNVCEKVMQQWVVRFVAAVDASLLMLMLLSL